jgi:hypothetical protein
MITFSVVALLNDGFRQRAQLVSEYFPQMSLLLLDSSLVINYITINHF